MLHDAAFHQGLTLRTNLWHLEKEPHSNYERDTSAVVEAQKMLILHGGFQTIAMLLLSTICNELS